MDEGDLRKRPFNADLIDRIAAALRTAYHADMRIALCGEFHDVARYAVRRWRSSARRGVRAEDIQARINDLAKGLANRGRTRIRFKPGSEHLKVAEIAAAMLPR